MNFDSVHAGVHAFLISSAFLILLVRGMIYAHMYRATFLLPPIRRKVALLKVQCLSPAHNCCCLILTLTALATEKLWKNRDHFF